MAPGFIGVGAGRWTTPSVIPLPPHPEIYSAGTVAGQWWVGYTDKSVATITLPSVFDEAGPSHVTSLRDSRKLFYYGRIEVPDSDPVSYVINVVTSDDGGTTWSDPVPLPFLSGGRVPDAELGELALYAIEHDDVGTGGRIYRSLNEADWGTFHSSGNLQAYEGTSVRLYVVQLPGIGSPHAFGPVSALDTSGGSPELFPDTFGIISKGGDDGRVLVYNEDDADHRSVKLATALSLVDTDIPVEITNVTLWFPSPREFGDARCNELGTWIAAATRPEPYDGVTWEGDFRSELWRSTDGTTWTIVHAMPPANIGEGVAGLPSVGYCSTPAGVWWAGGFRTDVGDPPESQFVWLRSGDDGLTWEVVVLPTQDTMLIRDTPEWVSGGKPDTRWR